MLINSVAGLQAEDLFSNRIPMKITQLDKMLKVGPLNQPHTDVILAETRPKGSLKFDSGRKTFA